MTNFEKWKEELTVDMLITNEHNVRLECQICPAINYCSESRSFYQTCGLLFRNWANQEADSE